MPAPRTQDGWLSELVESADRFVRARIDRLAAAARRQTERLAEQAGERLARHLVEQISRRLAARLAWSLAGVGVLFIGALLIALGVAGALGELYGRLWVGQLAAGGLALLVALVAFGIGRARARRRREEKAERADERGRPQAGVEPDAGAARRRPIVDMGAASAIGLLAGALLTRSNGRSATDD